MAKLTMIGMNRFDPTLFDGLTFPAGINKDLAINEILIRSGEFEILYPQPDFLKMQIEMWGKKHYRTFAKWVEALAKEFDPLYNYDRYEEYTDEKAGTDTRSGQSSVANTQTEIGKIKSTESGTESTANVSDATTKTDGSRSTATSEVNSTKGDAENKVSAYDSATYSAHDKTDTTGNSFATNTTGETSGTESTSSGTSNTSTARGGVSEDESEKSAASAQAMTEDESRASNEIIKHTAHLYGNIGVTTSTQMLEDFLRLERFCIYEQIADIFCDEFCIMIY